MEKREEVEKYREGKIGGREEKRATERRKKTEERKSCKKYCRQSR